MDKGLLCSLFLNLLRTMLFQPGVIFFLTRNIKDIKKNAQAFTR